MAPFRKILCALLLIVTGCSQSAPAPASPNDSALYYPYSPVYSNSYAKGSGKLAQQVLNFWKEYETGDVRHTAAAFADTLTFILPDTILCGPKTSVLEEMKKRRDDYTDMQSYIDSWIPLRETNRNEDLVFLWGRQDGTTPKNKRDYRVLHEIWRFDTFGKIRQLEQYLTHAH